MPRNFEMVGSAGRRMARLRGVGQLLRLGYNFVDPGEKRRYEKELESERGTARPTPKQNPAPIMEPDVKEDEDGADS